MGKGNLYIFNQSLVLNPSKPLLVEQMSKQAVLNNNNKKIHIYTTGLQKMSSFNNITEIFASKAKLVQMQLVVNFRTNSVRSKKSLTWLHIRISWYIL